MSEVPQTDVSRPSALPTASLLNRPSQPTIDQNSAEYLEAIEEEWNKKVDVEVDTLVDGMVDLVSLASVRVLTQGGGMELDDVYVCCRSGTRTSSVSLRSHSRRSAEQSRWYAHKVLYIQLCLNFHLLQ